MRAFWLKIILYGTNFVGTELRYFLPQRDLFLERNCCSGPQSLLNLGIMMRNIIMIMIRGNALQKKTQGSDNSHPIAVKRHTIILRDIPRRLTKLEFWVWKNLRAILFCTVHMFSIHTIQNYCIAEENDQLFLRFASDHCKTSHNYHKGYIPRRLTELVFIII